MIIIPNKIFVYISSIFYFLDYLDYLDLEKEKKKLLLKTWISNMLSLYCNTIRAIIASIWI